MTATILAETFENRATEYNDRAVRRYTRKFFVLTDTANDGPLTVRIASGIPRLTTPYVEPNGVTDLGSICVNIRTEQRADNPFLWDVTCEYSSESERPDRMQDNPIARPTDISGDWETFQVPVVNDVVNGNLVGNSAGQAFQPFFMKDQSRFILTMERNELNPDFVGLSLYADKINNDVFFGYDPLTVKCRPIRWRRMFENGLYYFRMTYQFAIRQETWLLQCLDQGKAVRKAPNNNTLLAVVDDQGKAVSNDVPLNGQGGLLQFGQEPVVLTFNQYLAVPFANLNLP
jgi:hypothetical protein